MYENKYCTETAKCW